MSNRTVTVVIEIVERLTGTYVIDERDYLEWLEGDDDTDDAMRAYLVAGDESEVIASVYDGAIRTGSREIWSSEIDRVTRKHAQAEPQGLREAVEAVLPDECWIAQSAIPCTNLIGATFGNGAKAARQAAHRALLDRFPATPSEPDGHSSAGAGHDHMTAAEIQERHGPRAEPAPSDLAGLLAREVYRSLYPGSINMHDSERAGYAPDRKCREIADRLAAVIVRDWLPEHDRTVRAEALRGFDTDEMAEALGGKSAWLTSASHVANIVRHWLDEEADRIESNESEGR